ncbi:MAG: polysaccharide deacetylase family protein, partial [Gemmatimonadaceae bacterium]
FAGIAAPLLLEAGLSATVFIVTDRAGLTNEWSAAADEGLPVLPLMAWDEIESLARAGIDIGAHTRSHLRLARVSDVKVLTDEIVGSGAEIESRIGVRPQSFAYPYGQLSDQAASIVRDNYERGCTTEMRALATGDDAARLPRLDAYYLRQPRILESWGTPRFARYIRARALGRRVRRAITVLAGA